MSQKINTKIWLEEPEDNNEFATKKAFCHGYDVYGQMLGNASWSQMVFLMFTGQAPTEQQDRAFNALAVALANSGPRDPAVHAAMCAGVGGSVTASALIAYLGIGAGQVGGSREVFLAMNNIKECAQDVEKWNHRLLNIPQGVDDTWQPAEHTAGFEIHGVTTATIVAQSLQRLSEIIPSGATEFLNSNKDHFEQIVQSPINMQFVAACVLADLGFAPQTGEMLHLMLRMPGAAAHALEQYEYGFKNFPFYSLDLQDDPLKKEQA